MSSTVYDGNTLTLSHNDEEGLFEFGALIYASSTTYAAHASTTIRSQLVRNPIDNSIATFGEHIQTPDQNFLAFYDGLLNQTIFVKLPALTMPSLTTPPPVGEILQTASGLVMPYVETREGEVVVGY